LILVDQVEVFAYVFVRDGMTREDFVEEMGRYGIAGVELEKWIDTRHADVHDAMNDFRALLDRLGSEQPTTEGGLSA